MSPTGHRRTLLRRRGTAVLLAVGLAVSAMTLGADGAPLESTPVRTLPAYEINPAADGRWFVWARDTTAKPFVFAYYAQKGDGPRIRVSPHGTIARGGGVDGRTVVYYLTPEDSDPDIYAFDLRTRRRTRLPAAVNTPANEYAPSISGRWLLFGRMTYPRSRILLYDQRSGEVRVVARRNVEAWPGQVNGAYATWEADGVFRYHIPSGTNHRFRERPGTRSGSPAVSADGTVYVCRTSGDGTAAIVRRRVRLPVEVVHTLPAGRVCGDLFVKDRADGVRVVYFTAVPESSGGIEGADIFKVVDRAAVPRSVGGPP